MMCTTSHTVGSAATQYPHACSMEITCIYSIFEGAEQFATNEIP